MKLIIPRIQKFLKKQIRKLGLSFADAPDPRQQGKVEHTMSSILWSLMLGLISNQPTLRDVEEMTGNLSDIPRKLVPKGISDTTLDTEIRRLDYEYLSNILIKQIRGFNRSKMLKPSGLPCGVATIDGKNLATVDHDAGGTGHKRTSENAKWHKKDKKNSGSGKPYWLMPVLRATLTSAEARPCILQMPLPPGTGESTVCPDFVDAINNAYGRSDMVEILDFDSGFTSLANADHVNDRGYAYVFALKGNQMALHAEAQRLLYRKAKHEKSEAQTDWEPRNGGRIRRKLWRTDEMRGYWTDAGCWDHLRQTWYVLQETEYPDGRIEQEHRFFVSSLLWNRLSAQQILTLVRRHWAIENDTFNSLDLQWREDSGPWCTQGQSVWCLGLMRIMAYNIVQCLRRRRLRPKDDSGAWLTPMRWRTLFEKIRDALKFEFLNTTVAQISV